MMLKRRPKPAPKPGPSAAPFRQFATRCSVPNFRNPANTAARSRSAHISRSNVTSLKLLFPNYYVDGMLMGSTFAETSTGATASISAAIEYPAGTFYRVKFSGSNNGAIPAGGTLLSDAVTVTIPTGATFWVRSVFIGSGGIFDTGTGGENSPAIFNSTNFGEATDVNTSADNTMGGAYGGTGAAGYIYRPLAIVSQVTASAALIIGDSRCHGSGGVADASGDYGEIARSVGASFGYTNYSMGSFAPTNLIASHTRFVALAPYYTHLICQLGINEFNFTSLTAAQIVANLQTIWGYFPGKIICQSTFPPITTSTDGWVTVANQTVNAYNTKRIAVNGLLRGIPAGLNVLYEIADVVESARDSGKWKVTGYTNDGVHESAGGYQSIVISGAIAPDLTAGIVGGGTTSGPSLYSEDFSGGTVPSGWTGLHWGGAGGTETTDNSVLSVVSGALQIASTTTTKPFAHAIKPFNVTGGHHIKLDADYASSGGGIPNIGIITPDGSVSVIASGSLATNSSGHYTGTGIVPDGVSSLYLLPYNNAGTTSVVSIDNIVVTDLDVASAPPPGNLGTITVNTVDQSGAVLATAQVQLV